MEKVSFTSVNEHINKGSRVLLQYSGGLIKGYYIKPPTSDQVHLVQVAPGIYFNYGDLIDFEKEPDFRLTPTDLGDPQGFCYVLVRDFSSRHLLFESWRPGLNTANGLFPGGAHGLKVFHGMKFLGKGCIYYSERF